MRFTKGLCMSNPWFRLYAEFYHDPKVQILSEQDQRRLVMILCLRCNGCVTLQDKYVTFSLRISDSEWQQTKVVFIESGFIDSDNNVLNWDKRQYISDSSAARVAKHRALHKTVTVTPCNVTVTPPEQIQNRTDTEQIQSKSKTSTTAFALPDWVDKDNWDLWMQTRKGKKMIAVQMQAQVKKLEKWKIDGLDYRGALSNAAINGYAGLFLPDTKKSLPANRQSNNEQIKAAAYQRLFGGKEIESI